jgi:hypothetical protein
MAETSDMGDTHAVGETATPKMGDIYAAVGETVTSDMGDTYAAETHAVMDDAPISADAHVSEAVTDAVVKVPAIVWSIETVRIAVVAKVIRALIGAAVSRIGDSTGRASVLVGIGLGSSRLRSSKCSHRQSNKNPEIRRARGSSAGSSAARPAPPGAPRHR